MIFLPKLVHLHGQKFSGVLEKLSCTSSGFWIKMQNTTFLKINVFLVKCFIKLKCRRLQTGLAILKNIKHFNFFKGQIFMQFSNIAFFRDF